MRYSISRTLKTGYTGATGVTVAAESRVYRMAGGQIVCSLVFNVTSSSGTRQGDVWIRGLPKPAVKWFCSAAAVGDKSQRLYVSTDGSLCLDDARQVANWHSLSVCYPAAD